MRISFEKNPLIIQSDSETIFVNIKKYDEGEVSFKVKAVGTSAGLEHKYKNRAILGESGDFNFENQIINMEKTQETETIEVKIFNTERVKTEAKYFTLKLINEEGDYEFSPNSICHCYIVGNIKDYVIENIERYNLPLTKIVNNIVGGNGNEEENDGGGGNLQKAELKTKLLLKTNDDGDLEKNFPIEIWRMLAEAEDYRRAIQCREYGLYKMLLLERYTPEAEYEFQYEVFDSLGNSSDIMVHLINMDFLNIMKAAFLTYRRQSNWYKQSDYGDALSFVKKDSVITKLRKSEKTGTFKIKPTTSRKLLCFSSRLGSRPDGIGFKYYKETKKFELRSF